MLFYWYWSSIKIPSHPFTMCFREKTSGSKPTLGSTWWEATYRLSLLVCYSLDLHIWPLSKEGIRKMDLWLIQFNHLCVSVFLWPRQRSRSNNIFLMMNYQLIDCKCQKYIHLSNMFNHRKYLNFEVNNVRLVRYLKCFFFIAASGAYSGPNYLQFISGVWKKVLSEFCQNVLIRCN